MASVPIIIPGIVIIVALVAVFLSIYTLIKKLISKNQKKCKKYHFGPPKKTELTEDNNSYNQISPSAPTRPTSPANSTLNSDSNNLLPTALVTYPALTVPGSAPNRRSKRNREEFEKSTLDTVDRRSSPFENLSSLNSSNSTQDDSLPKMLSDNLNALQDLQCNEIRIESDV